MKFKNRQNSYKGWKSDSNYPLDGNKRMGGRRGLPGSWQCSSLWSGSGYTDGLTLWKFFELTFVIWPPFYLKVTLYVKEKCLVWWEILKSQPGWSHEREDWRQMSVEPEHRRGWSSRPRGLSFAPQEKECHQLLFFFFFWDNSRFICNCKKQYR